jgi:flavin reductase (DIM6/NTAB) family NADH-FMN oxidoreductase RutF
VKRSLGPKTLIQPTPTWIVGSYDRQGRPNGMTAAWGGICCSAPPCVAVSLRKATYSYGNLTERRAFTISVPTQSQAKEADYFGLTSGRNTDKFAATGWTPVRSELVDAPYVEECPLVLECKVLHIFELGLHTQFVGEILDVKANEEVLDATGMPDIQKVLPIIFSPGNRVYYGVGGSLGHGFALGKEIGRKTTANNATAERFESRREDGD